MNIIENIEHWALIDGTINYEISSFGRIRNNKNNKIMALCDNGRGYLFKKINKKNHYIHKEVAKTFCFKSDEIYNIVDHIDRNKHNNIFTNLRWTTQSINCKNMEISARNTTGYKGIHKTEHGWRVSYSDNDKNQRTKRFTILENAINFRKEQEQLNGYFN